MELSAAVETVAVRSRFATLYSSLVDEGEFWGETDIGWLAEVRVAPPTHEDKSAAEEESVGMSSLHTFSQDLVRIVLALFYTSWASALLVLATAG